MLSVRVVRRAPRCCVRAVTDPCHCVAWCDFLWCTQANQHEDDEDDYLLDHSIVLYLMVPSPPGQEGDMPQVFSEFYTQRMLVGEVVDKIEAQMTSRGGAGAGSSK